MGFEPSAEHHALLKGKTSTAFPQGNSVVLHQIKYTPILQPSNPLWFIGICTTEILIQVHGQHIHLTIWSVAVESQKESRFLPLGEWKSAGYTPLGTLQLLGIMESMYTVNGIDF